MKATEQMIDAACEAYPSIQRRHITKIVQTALDSHEAPVKLESPRLRHVVGIAAVSVMFSLVPFISIFD
jgi:hypothetical protein